MGVIDERKPDSLVSTLKIKSLLIDNDFVALVNQMDNNGSMSFMYYTHCV